MLFCKKTHIQPRARAFRFLCLCLVFALAALWTQHAIAFQPLVVGGSSTGGLSPPQARYLGSRTGLGERTGPGPSASGVPKPHEPPPPR
jgi:hypothetical protein